MKITDLRATTVTVPLEVPYKDLQGGRPCTGGRPLAATGQRQHLRDQHGRAPGRGEDRR